MKKTLLLSALVASAASFAGTTGFVEGFVETSTDFAKNGVHSVEFSETGLNYGSKFKVEVNNSGFSFGGKLNNATAFNNFSNDLVNGYFNSDDSNLWVKYDLPEYKGIKSYVKGTVEAKPIINDVKRFNGIIEVNAEKEMNGVTVAFNNETVFPFQKSTAVKMTDATAAEPYEFELLNKKDLGNDRFEADVVLYNYTINNTTKLSAKKDFDKIKEVKGELELGTSATVKTLAHMPSVKAKNTEYWKDDMYTQKITGSKVDFNFNYLNANLSGKYVGVKDLEVTGELNGRYNRRFGELSFNYYSDFKSVKKLENKAFKVKPFTLLTRVDAEYKGIKDTTITGGASLLYRYKKDDSDLATSLRLGVEYTGVKNLTLGAKAEGMKVFSLDNKGNSSTYVYLNLNGKYDYKATDKLTITPELNLDSYNFFGEEKLPFFHNSDYYRFEVSPKISAKYMPTDSLTISGNVGTTSVFEKIGKTDFGYTVTNVKTGLNVKYTW